MTFRFERDKEIKETNLVLFVEICYFCDITNISAMNKKFIKTLILSLTSLIGTTLFADNLVILHTNDTHSNIDVAPDGTGGVLPRKAIIDSVRNAEKNVVLVDAGDMVQGTLYFN